MGRNEDRAEAGTGGGGDGQVPEAWRSSYAEEDRRWAPSHQYRDWLWLLVAMAVVLGFFITVYFTEPGLR